MPLLKQGFNKVRSDESSSSCDEVMHGGSLMAQGVGRRGLIPLIGGVRELKALPLISADSKEGEWSKGTSRRMTKAV